MVGHVKSATWSCKVPEYNQSTCLSTSVPRTGILSPPAVWPSGLYIYQTPLDPGISRHDLVCVLGSLRSQSWFLPPALWDEVIGMLAAHSSGHCPFPGVGGRAQNSQITRSCLLQGTSFHLPSGKISTQFSGCPSSLLLGSPSAQLE